MELIRDRKSETARALSVGGYGKKRQKTEKTENRIDRYRATEIFVQRLMCDAKETKAEKRTDKQARSDIYIYIYACM